MTGGTRSWPSLATRLLAQMAVVVGVLVAGKVYLVWRVAEIAPTSPRMLAALPQELAAAAVFGTILVASALPRLPALRTLGEVVVVVALMANCLLIFIAQEIHGLFTIDADTPRTWGALFSVLADYGSAARWAAIAFVGAAMWVAPLVVTRVRLRPGRWTVRLSALVLPLVLAACVVATPSPSHEQDDAFEVGSLRNNALAHYLGGTVTGRGFAGMRPAEPESFEEIARALGPVAGAAGVHEASAALEELAGGRFNVVLVVLESTGMTAFDFDAPKSDRHPFLTRVRDRMVRFARYSSPAPHSETALAAMFCSQLRLPVGLAKQSARAREHCRALPGLLEAGGVRTGFFQSAYVGDWIDAGFFERLRFGVAKDAARVIEERHASGRPVESRNGILQEHETVTELLGWVGERCEHREPFFGVYYSWVAHAPYPAEHGDKVSFADGLAPRERHRHLVRTLDEQIGRIYDTVSREECGRPTVILVTGDHGEAFEEHAGNHYHVMHVYEENIRVPLLVIAPGVTPREVDRVASHIDLAPTIVDLTLGSQALASAEAPEGGDDGRPFQGRSLLRPGAPWPAFSVSLQGEGRASIRFGQFKLISSPRSSWLFDTDADPGERRDLTLEQPELARALRDAFGGWVTHQVRYQSRS